MHFIERSRPQAAYAAPTRRVWNAEQPKAAVVARRTVELEVKHWRDRIGLATILREWRNWQTQQP